MRCTDADPEPILELELVKVVGDLGSTLPREDIHAVVDNCHGEVAAGWGAVPTLLDLFPLWLRAGQVNRPHVIKTSVPVVPRKDPQPVVEDGSSVG